MGKLQRYGDGTHIQLEVLFASVRAQLQVRHTDCIDHAGCKQLANSNVCYSLTLWPQARQMYLLLTALTWELCVNHGLP